MSDQGAALALGGREVTRSEPNSMIMNAILATFLDTSESEVGIKSFESYKSYYEKTWVALGEGEPPELDLMDTVSDDHVRCIVEEVMKITKGGSPCFRAALRENLRKELPFNQCPKDKPQSLNRMIDLSLRLWLVLYIRDGFAHAAKSIKWDDTISLQELVASQFRKPRLLSPVAEKMFDITLPDNFNALNLRRYSAIKVKLTSSLNEHLELDRERSKLKIFPLKYYLYGLRKSKVEIIPNEVIDEYIKTMNLLFPTRDPKTQKFLRKKFLKKGQTFGTEGPVDYHPGPLYLSDFHFWRDRLSTLYAEFCSPPPSMTQLFNDRRNVLQWYTFWFAVVILGLTIIFGVISSITACLSTLYTHEALVLAREAARAGQSCICTPLVSPRGRNEVGSK